MDKIRKDYHIWLSEKVRNIKLQYGEKNDARLLLLMEALLDEIDFLSNDFSDRTKRFADLENNFAKLQIVVYNLLEGSIQLALKSNKTEQFSNQIPSMQKDMQDIRKDQEGLLKMKAQLDERARKRAEEIKNKQNNITKELPGVK